VEKAGGSVGLGRLWEDLAQALALLTIIPVPSPAGGRVAASARCVVFFPVVGALVGGALWGLDAVLAATLPSLVRAALLLILLLVITGGLHLDGLADTCDGLFSRAAGRRAAEIMRDSRVGALGAAGLCLGLLLRFSLFASLAGPWCGPALLVAAVTGRQAMVLSMGLFPAPPGVGLSQAFARQVTRGRLTASLVITAAIVAATLMVTAGRLGAIEPVGDTPLWPAAAVATAVVVALACGLGVAWLVHRRLGGVGGDAYGAVNELTESALLLLAVGWLP